MQSLQLVIVVLFKFWLLLAFNKVSLMSTGVWEHKGATSLPSWSLLVVEERMRSSDSAPTPWNVLSLHSSSFTAISSPFLAWEVLEGMV